MRIYTGSGDDGTTGLYGAGRVAKTDPRMEAIGAIDELNACIGEALTRPLPDSCRDVLFGVQHKLFDLGAELASVSADLVAIHPANIQGLEADMDRMDEQLPPLREFILPGGSPGAAALHVARTVCRRAEREVLRFREFSDVAGNTLVYLNRLSDWLFMAARFANAQAGVPDTTWKKTP